MTELKNKDAIAVMPSIYDSRKMDWQLMESANAEMGLTNIKGKDYVMVAQRVRAFRKVFPLGRIATDIILSNDGEVVFKCVVMDDMGNELATGYAHEKANSSQINRTSFIENCETSAVGRALGFAGFGIVAGIASAEEVDNAQAQQNAQKDDLSAEKPKDNKEVGKDRNALVKAQNKAVKLIMDNEISLNYVLKMYKAETVKSLSEKQANHIVDNIDKIKDMWAKAKEK